MLNKSVIAFQKDDNKRVKYGKWLYDRNKLYFNWCLVAEKEEGNLVTHSKRITETNFEWNTYHAIDKVISYLERLDKGLNCERTK